jgi:hypothetical protein
MYIADYASSAWETSLLKYSYCFLDLDKPEP